MMFSFSMMAFAHVNGRDVLFNDHWKFHLGSLAGAEAPDYDDSAWRVLNLPHDWSVEPVATPLDGVSVGPFSKLSEKRYPSEAQMGGGGWDVGQTLGGEGWYRKTFTLEESDVNKQITLFVEAASYQSEVWVNGYKAYFNRYAYTPYRVDITEFLNKAGDTNVIAIKAVNEGHNSRWYVGSGLYRNVWLIKTAKTHLDKWETFLTTRSIDKKQAVVDFSSLIYNNVEGTSVELSILSPTKQEVYRQKIEPDAEGYAKANMTIPRPQLWSVDKPQLYQAVLRLTKGDELLDETSTDFGIRTIEVSAKEGFKLNGKPMLLKGCCIHHDNGLLGAAAIARADEHRVELLKQNGFNAVRCSHNLASESFLEACDRLGLLVIHETFDQWLMPKRQEDYHQYFPQFHEADLTVGIKRDRNHPSIFMWSIGNEIPGRITPEGMETAEHLRKVILSLDNTRPIMAAICDWDWKRYSWDEQSEKAFSSLDIGGYNYMWRKYESDHEKYPERIMFGSESYPKEAAVNWNLVEKLPYVIGDFVWTAIDYVGEAGLAHTLELAEGEHNTQFMDWPWYNAWCGDLDLIGNKKPQAYYRNVLWGVSPITMAVHKPIAPGKREDVNGWGWTDERQSWTWKGLEGQTMTVHVYSRSPKVSLTLNGKLLGIKDTDKATYTATFEVPYAPGELIARNIGKDKSSFVLTTAGEPSAIRLKADRAEINACHQDLSFISIEVVDQEDNMVPDAEVPLQISSEGPASIIAGNGSYIDLQSFRSLTPKTFRGRALAIVQPEGNAGKVTVRATAEGMTEQSITILTK